MTDNEIINALELCATLDEENCKECPGKNICNECDGNLTKMVLDLIHRLKREGNKYRNTAQAQKGELARLNEKVVEQREEIDGQDIEIMRLGHEIERLNQQVSEQKSEIKTKDTEIAILIRKNETLKDKIAEQQERIGWLEVCLKDVEELGEYWEVDANGNLVKD